MSELSPAERDRLRQGDYYAKTASDYGAKHIHDLDEHMLALGFFAALARRTDHSSILDVGAGTGRAVTRLKREFPGSQIVGVEPVAALREVGKRENGLADHELIDGDATALGFPSDSFDWVVETGVLHHIRDYRTAIAEMCRVARVGVLVSDSNNLGQGGLAARIGKRLLKIAGAWPVAVWIQTGGRMSKYSEGDGVYYSFCAFDCVPAIRRKFSNIHYMNTQPSGPDLYGSAGHVAIVAFNK